MTRLRLSVWAGIGAAALAASACQPAANAPAPASAAPSSMAISAAPAQDGQAGDLLAAMPAEDAAALRVALMKAQIAAAMRLVDEGAGTEAAIHFRRPVDDVYAPAEADYAARGLALDIAKFAVAAENAALGKTAREIRPMRDALDRQIDRLAPRKFSKPVVIKALLTQLARAYRQGVEGPTVTNATDYQDAYGLALTAADLLADAARENAGGDQTRSAQLQREGEALVNLFPSAIAPPSPASAGEVEAQISRIQLAYPAMQ